MPPSKTLLFTTPASAARVFDALLVGYAVNAALPADVHTIARNTLRSTIQSVLDSGLASFVWDAIGDLAGASHPPQERGLPGACSQFRLAASGGVSHASRLCARAN